MSMSASYLLQGYKTTLNGSYTSESALQWKLRREFGVRSQESPREEVRGPPSVGFSNSNCGNWDK